MDSPCIAYVAELQLFVLIETSRRILMPNRPVVAHIHEQFLPRSETFIYSYISRLNRADCICIGQRPFVNMDLFPIPRSNRYVVSGAPPGLRWLCRFALRRVTGRHILAERIIRSRNTRLLHAHFGPNGWWALPLKRVLGVPLVTSFYGSDTAPSLRTHLDWPRHRQKLFDEGDLFLVEGPFVRQKLVRLGCRREKVQIQRIALDLRQTPFKPRKLLSRTKVVVIFAGRFVEKKGLAYALQAVRSVLDMGFALEFRIIGDGPLANRIYKLIRETRLEKDVKLYGFLNYQDYLSEMNEADILIQPSVTAANGDTEGALLQPYWRPKQWGCQ